ncbi:MAG TPA: type II toxin-antitoxin system VapC family toxin [Stellaceae bacterium]|nr:type II toxin-antitoxin system VapC family toxin [Stellaceae bacterium]
MRAFWHLILPEATSDKIAALLRDLPVEEFAVIHWTRVEFSSLIAREVRVGGLDRETARKIDARFDAMVEESFAVLLPDSDDFSRARHYLGRFETGLRAGDALHLAIAANRHAAAIYTLDKRLLRAGEILGLPVSLGISAAERPD